MVGFNLLLGNQYKKFLKTAEKASGKILAKEERVIDPKNRRKENWLRYSYSANGQEFTGEDRIEYQDMWMDLKEHAAIDVLYNRDNPKESYPEPVLARRLGMAHIITGIPVNQE